MLSLEEKELRGHPIIPESLSIIDAHAHCGVIDRSMSQSFETYTRQLAETGIRGVALFSPVLEIYDRYDFHFTDTPAWRLRRQESNAFLLSLDASEPTVFPYFFIWNDFAIEHLSPAHCGIKWHRHTGEPVYHYDKPRCHAALDEIRRRNLPVVLEEEFDNTLRFILDLAKGMTVIIPHMGLLNGGFQPIAEAGLWELDNVWADTALASPYEIDEYIRRYGHSRLLFGSDFPFGSPPEELRKVRSLGLESGVAAAILAENFLRLQARVVRL